MGALVGLTPNLSAGLLAILLLILVVLLTLAIVTVQTMADPVLGGAAPSPQLNSLQFVSQGLVSPNAPTREQARRSLDTFRQYLTLRMPYFAWEQMRETAKHRFPDKLRGLANECTELIVQGGQSDGQIMATILSKIVAAVPPAKRAKGKVPLQVADRTKTAEGMRQLLETALRPIGGVHRYLDVGCGEGQLTLAIAKVVDSKETHACDLFRTPPDFLNDSAAQYHTAPSDKLPFPDGHFDLVTCMLSAHHYPDIEASLQEIRRVLAPRGVLLIRDHDCTDPYYAAFLDFSHHAREIITTHKMVLRAGHETEDFEKDRPASFYFSQAELGAKAAAVGFNRVGGTPTPTGLFRLFVDAFA
jgi:SAM-dependent methyltransferase